MTRAAALADFLATTEFAKARLDWIPGDASKRRYARLHLEGACFILMDADPAEGEDVRPFLAVAQHLRDNGLSAPKVYATDESTGFLVIEDLGPTDYAEHLETHTDENRLYSAATMALCHLHRAPHMQAAPMYGPSEMAERTTLAPEWYGSPDQAAEFEATFKAALDKLTHWGPLALRDYHAQNLIWRPEESGLAQVGLLDFQDAGISHAGYDLASLLFDARRDVGAPTVEAMISLYCREMRVDPADFTHEMHLINVQRNVRILGIFARLGRAYGKPHYVDLIPRVWGHIQHSAPHVPPEIKRLIDCLPEPSTDLLRQLKVPA